MDKERFGEACQKGCGGLALRSVHLNSEDGLLGEDL